MDGKADKEPGQGQSLALAAAFAMLGVSVGVNVEEVMAAAPTDAASSQEITVDSQQSKVQPGQQPPALQQKHDRAVQQKLNAGQKKLPAVQKKADRAIQQKLDAAQQRLPSVQQKDVRPVQ